MAFVSDYMARAVALARKHFPSPNPRVGAVVVKNGAIIGEGAHEKPGTPHAEVHALNQAGTDAGGADLYVTLEPCVHFGRTGPCVKAIEKAGIRRVFVGLTDPDKRVNGQGIQYLKSVGITVETGIDEPSCRELLEGYITHRTQGRPHITLKAAITLDGYLATNTFDSKWISSKQSRRVAHQLRAESDAILVGINTVEKDDPSLTTRDADGPSPKRVILDSNLRVAPESRILRSASETPVYLVHNNAALQKQAAFQGRDGVTLINAAAEAAHRTDLLVLMRALAAEGILSLLVEGGSTVHSAFLAAGLADRIILFIAPKILGRGIPFTTFPGVDSIQQGLSLSVDELTAIDGDIFYRAKIKNQD